MSIFGSILGKLGFDEEETPNADVMPYNPKPAVIPDEDDEDEEEFDEEEDELDEDEGEEYDEDYDDEEYDDEDEDEDYDDEDEDDEEEEEEDEEISKVDVLAKLKKLAAKSDEDLNWRNSIVDLLKLLGMDSSLSARKALAKELKCPAKKLASSAEMNTWLHQAVLQKLAQHGGNIPPELLD